MHTTAILAAGLMLALAPTLALAQNGGNLNGPDARSTIRAANTARSGRTMPLSREAAPDTMGSVKRRSAKRNKRSQDGIDIPGICIGCEVR